jgi:hypothetical protein
MGSRRRSAETQGMEDFRSRLTVFGIALVAMMYVVVYQTHLILTAVAKLHR